jgi:Domain of unknown function (DUF1992)
MPWLIPLTCPELWPGRSLGWMQTVPVGRRTRAALAEGPSVESIPVTERKPQGMSFPSWIDQQINEAMERGAFDNLAGAGKPLPRRGEEDAGQAWLREYVRREGISSEELLPTPLRLRKERERLAETVQFLRSEQQVRDAATELNERILRWRRFPSGPPIFVPLVDEDAMVALWREGQAPTPERTTASNPTTASERTAVIRKRRRWWRRNREQRDEVQPPPT